MAGPARDSEAMTTALSSRGWAFYGIASQSSNEPCEKEYVLVPDFG
jgi:hypothetical protein